MPAGGEAGVIETAISVILSIYNWLTNTLEGFLSDTIFKARPDLADQFGNAITNMVGFTAIYLLLVAFEAVKKILGYILAIGWILIIAAISLSIFG